MPRAKSNESTGETSRECIDKMITAGDPSMQAEVLSRLKKIEGQVRGVHKMVQDCRDCGDIVIQLTAIKAAVNRVGATVLACHLADKIKSDLSQNNDINASLNEFMSIFKKFS
ncbi:DNA-binding transcriptional regulator, FrmR family [Desulfotomaculum arcticum]|uniref:DNA-binding transcriptional regulator, FrmR family n=1 Tax=Desulfotruncus arcticus DSM 17038 TaxID=1121424 RepID=A0A1I2U4G0_9FIRM|nr:metal-sensitive transcriptional regulator [Desulfotruncus arcticus]SFG72020.1 DNA-binding transcriptional regulator, FrmR family [Desulfotomaculum arcticum] [Desulfotruncus arcticus DSM 17038]